LSFQFPGVFTSTALSTLEPDKDTTAFFFFLCSRASENI
jgi:hypothetical protein